MRCPAWVLLAALVLRAPAQSGIVSPTPDNLLLIVADDLGVTGVGAYGQSATAPPTLAIDALARRGVLFRRAYANPVCSPSRACIQTGRHAFRTGVGASIAPRDPFTPPLSLSEWTLPKVLDFGNAGFAHAAIGKWHLGNHTTGGPRSPNLAGYGHFAGFEWGALADYYAWPRTVDGVTAASQAYATTQMVDDALAWIRRARPPWFCVLNLVAPHSPYQAPPPHLHGYDLRGLDPRRQPIPFYKAKVQAMDVEIGRLLAGLGAQLAHTNVIFTSDNGTPGEVAEAPLTRHRAKGTVYEGGIRVPLVVAGPCVATPGRVEDALVHMVDVFQTALELCGVNARRVVPPAITLDGVSFLPHLRQPGLPSRRSLVFSEFFLANFPDRTGSSAMTDGRYKLVRHYSPFGTTMEEFYDLAHDPHERDDLIEGIAKFDRFPTVEVVLAYATLRAATLQLRASP